MTPSRTTGRWAALALALALAAAGCAQGPADIIGDGLPAQAVAGPQAGVLTPQERADLARDLDATANRQASEGRDAVETLPSAMALSVIRQQQEEEARSLLEAATTGEGGSSSAAPQAAACDPSAADAGACAPAAQ